MTSLAALHTNSTDPLRYFRRRAAADDCADLLAETVTTAWRRRIDTPTAPEEARRWLFGIAHRTLLNFDRSTTRRHALAARVRNVLTRDDALAPAADEHLEVRDAIAALPSDLAEIVRLIHWEGFTVSEAAVILRIGGSTARDRYRRARDQLRTSLATQVGPNLRSIGG